MMNETIDGRSKAGEREADREKTGMGRGRQKWGEEKNWSGETGEGKQMVGRQMRQGSKVERGDRGRKQMEQGERCTFIFAIVFFEFSVSFKRMFVSFFFRNWSKLS